MLRNSVLRKIKIAKKKFTGVTLLSTSVKTSKPEFQWLDAFQIRDQYTDEERMVQDTAKAYCQTKLMPRVLQANRKEEFDRNILKELGSLGLLGPTIQGILTMIMIIDKMMMDS
jgi:hypothetical protein